MNHKEALVVFAKAPIPGQVKTRLIGKITAEEAAELYVCFLRDTFAMMQDVQEDRENLSLVLCYTPADEIEAFETADLDGCMLLAQQGDNLSERMKNCLTDLFTAGFGSVVIIGADSPTLPPEIVIEAFAQLTEKNSVVIGPATDGGYYLIGMTQLYENLFAQINWSDNTVFATTQTRAQEVGIAMVVLPEWYDVDTPEELEKLTAEIRADMTVAPATRKLLKKLFTTSS